jgi:hypothetical protein
MRAKLLSPMLLSMLFALGACTSEDFDTESAVESVCAGKGVGVNIVKSPFEGEDATRVNISNNPYPKYEAIWTEGDAIGVFTLGSDYSWKCKNEKVLMDGANNIFPASEGDRVYAYYPYSPNVTSYTKIPYDLTGQKQIGNGNIKHMGKYDYMYCNEKIKSNTQTPTMNHVFSVFEIATSLPKPTTWRKVTVRSLTYKNYFKVSGTYNMSGTLTSNSKEDVITLDLQDVVTTKANEEVYFTIMMPQFNSSKIEVIIETDLGKFMSKTTPNLSFTKGRITLFDIKDLIPFEDRADDVDMGLSVKWAKYNVNNINHTQSQFYVAWGENNPYTTDKEFLNHLQPKRYFSWFSYDDVKTLESRDSCYAIEFKKYDYEHFIHDGQLRSEDDYAYNSYYGWRTPTKKEWEELLANTNSSRTSYILKNESGRDTTVYGFTLTSRINGNQIFLPMTGYMDGFSLFHDVANGVEPNYGMGCYWSADMAPEFHGSYIYAHAMSFGIFRNDQSGSNPNYTPKMVQMERYKGLAIRPVRDK